MTLRRCHLVGLMVVIGGAACGGAGDAPRRPELAETTQAASVPPGFVDEQVVAGIAGPTAFAFAPDGRIFVAQQDGRVRVVKNGTLLATPFASVPASFEGERGLLGVTVDPDGTHVYVYYTTATPVMHNRLSRFRIAGDVAQGGELVLLDFEEVGTCLIRLGGALHFGPDGKLYVAVGDSCDPAAAQSLATTLGKMLRLNPDASIPTDNPFFGSTSGTRRAIWALGLRNPFTFAFSRSGRMFINDVGLDGWEEINEGFAGANYGWPESEGPTSNPAHRAPVFAYAHRGSGLTGCAITGGAFYDPPVSRYPSAYVGKYLFADYCQGYVHAADLAARTSQEFVGGIPFPVDLAVGPDGLLYRLERRTGESGDPGSIARVRFAANQAPVIDAQPVSRTAGVGQVVSFTVGASGSQPLQFQWQRNGINIAGANGPTHSFTAALADNGATFVAVVTNAHGTVRSAGAVLTVSTNTAPVATINVTTGPRYSGGEVIAFTGSGSDAQDGALPASAFTWEVVFRHDTHPHPFIAPFSGQTSSSFTVPRTGHTETTVFYRIHLSVRDSAGLETATFVDVQPRLATLNLRTSPPGLTVTIDGSPVSTPVAIPSVVGIIRTLGAVTPQSAGGSNHAFASWSDGGAVLHDVTTPATDTTYTANFVVDSGTGCADVALPRVAAFSSSNEASAYGPGQAIDGNLGTRWSSESSDPQWLYVDLGAARKIRRVVLNWEVAYAQSYRIEVTDNPAGAWTTIFSRTNFGGGVDTISGLFATARYLRVFATTRATGWGDSLWELQVFGDLNPSCGAAPECGNGVIEGGETCDDGNRTSGDGCSSSCAVEGNACADNPLPRVGAAASSLEDASFPAALAIDGNPVTRWSSAFSDPQWISVDLGAVRRVRRVVLTWEVAHARTYQIEVAPAATGPWTPIFTRTNFGGGIDTIAGLSAQTRYVRMNATARATSWGNSLWEFQIFGDPNPACAGAPP